MAKPEDVTPITVTVEVAMQLMGIGMTKTYQLMNDGHLRSTKIGGRRLIFLTSINELLEQGVEPQPAAA